MIQLSNEQMRKLIQEETEKFLDEPYDESFDLVLEKKSKRQRLQQARKAQNQQITQAQQAAAAAKKAAATGTTPQEPMAEPQAAPATSTPPSTAGAKKMKPMPGSPGIAYADDDEPLPNVQPSWRQKLGKAYGATTKGLSDFAKSDLNVKGGEFLTKTGKNVGKALGGMAVGGMGLAGRGIGAGLGGLAKGVMGQFQGSGAKTQMQQLAQAHHKLQKSGIDNRTILQLAQLLQSGALEENQIAIKNLATKCLKSGKVKIIKEEKESITIDV